MGILDSRLEAHIIPVDYFGQWTPAHQTAARHQQAAFVEVSKEQFFASIQGLDVASSAQGDSLTGYGKFETRFGTNVGRMYADANGLVATRYLLARDFADKCAQRKTLTSRDYHGGTPEGDAARAAWLEYVGGHIGNSCGCKRGLPACH